jgi:predicted Fe-Mo cluster-binding NifX family protein
MSEVIHDAAVPLPNVRVAVATSTGERVDSHFSQSPFFDIYDVKEGAWTFAQRRANTEASCGCHSHAPGESAGHAFAKVAGFISDCQFVVANRIGSGAVGYLVDHGIRAAQFDDTVENALRALIASGKLTKLLRRQERK